MYFNLLMCYVTVQPGVWRWRTDKTGVVQDDSGYSRSGLWHPAWCILWRQLTTGWQAEM